MRTVQNTILGRIQTQSPCSRCRGTGKIISRPCTTCRGSGQVRKQRTVELKIYPGVENGHRIAIRGEGEPGANGGPQGDLYIFVTVKPHSEFQRKGADLYCTQKIPFTLAALGGSFELRGIDGDVSLQKIKPGTQPGDVLHLPGLGMPVPGAGTRRGQMHVTLQVEIPRKLTDRQRELLLSFDGGDNQQPAASQPFGRGRKKRR